MLSLQTLDTQRLLRFNAQVLDQALRLIAAHGGAGAPPYATPVGAHLRHVIEHYEALLFAAHDGTLNYDQRPRSRALETDAALAQRRVQALQCHLALWSGPQLATPIRVRGIGGVAGDFEFAVMSTLARELVFLASHALHHFALLQAHCEMHGIALDATFGRAPSTVAHDRAHDIELTHTP